MRTHRLCRLALTVTLLSAGIDTVARAGDLSTSPIASAVAPPTPLVLEHAIACVGDRHSLVAQPSPQWWPRPVVHAHPPARLQYPPLREVGMHLGVIGSLFSGAAFGIGGASYTRSVTDPLAVEGTIDGTFREGHIVGFTSLRAIARRYHPEFGEVFLSAGVARGFSGGDAIVYPHGRGFVLGGGVQPRLSSQAAVRVELQLLSFAHNMAGLRLSTGFLIGFGD